MSLNAKRSVRDTPFTGFEKDLKGVLGSDWYYSFDFVELYSMMKQHAPKDKKECWLDRLGEVVKEYIYILAYPCGPLERVARDDLSKEAFIAKNPAKAVSLKFCQEKTHFDYVDGGFVLFIGLCDPFFVKPQLVFYERDITPPL